MANLALMQKLKKASVIKHSSCLDDSVIFNKKDVIPTLIPAINIALSGTLDGGLTSGLTMWAGPSKHFKSMFSLLMAKAYMDKYPDAVMMFYDSEFGTPIDYFKSLGIDTSRVMHTPLMNIEEMKFDVQNVLESVDRGDKVIFVIDSVGNIASKKEVEDAINQKSVGDMTRAKQLKSFFRMVTPQLTVKDIPMVVINHTYETQEMFSKTVVAGGCMVEGTRIKLADGSLKEIQDVVTGEFVETLDGHKMVTASWNPDTLEDGEPECYEIEFEDGHKVIVSDKHPFLIKETGDKQTREWKSAIDLKVGDDVILSP